MADKERIKTEKALDGFAGNLAGCKALRSGSIAFVMPGKDGGEYRVECQAGSARVETGGLERAHQIEVLGSPDKVKALISGDHDAVTLFLSGGLRLRGDLRYASDLARELGIIQEAL